MIVRVDVQIATPDASVPSEDEIRWWMSHAVEAATDDDCAEVEIAVRIVGEDEGLELNKQYREGNKATNVLSFPADPLQPQIADGGPRILGDVVICAPIVQREALDQGKDPASHWSHLLVHGTLHLLGYDHQTVAEAERMEALERDLLAERGIADPYAVA